MPFQKKFLKLYLTCLAFRIFNAFAVQTYFDPDEYWQAPEIAHRIVFGYGHVTWEWESKIRSFVHPLLYAIGYFVLKQTNLDYAIWVV
ncbi:hypothetical protein HK096_007703, partial [Nowakowskiella sp. JEL0078]